MQFFFSIITFALVAEYGAYSKIGFVIFTGVTTMLICMAFIALYLLDQHSNPTVALVELAVNVVWWIFWLAAAACLADVVANLDGVYGIYGGFPSFDEVRASCAFAWITWVVWSLSTFISIKELLDGRKAPATVTAPPSGTDANVAATAV